MKAFFPSYPQHPQLHQTTHPLLNQQPAENHLCFKDRTIKKKAVRKYALRFHFLCTGLIFSVIIKLSRLYDDGTMMMTIAITVVKSITNYLLLHSFCIEHSVQIQNQIHQCCFTGFLPKICIIRK